MLDARELDFAIRNIELLDPLQKQRVLSLLEERERLARIHEAQTKFLSFVKMMWPDVILGAHHTIIAEAFEKLLSGEWNRLVINIGPRHSKSEMTSWLLPLWFLGLNPRGKIMQCMNTQDLAAGFGRRVRNVISKEAIATTLKGFDPYHEIFPDMDLAKDSGAASQWHDVAGGEYYGVGTGGKIAGRGADLLIIDDPHSEQEAKQAESNPSIFDDVYDWYVYGPRQRLQPGGKICVVQTRWSKRDLTGRLIRKMQEDQSSVADKWHVIEFPAILDENSPTERPLWPEYWPLATLQATRAALPVSAWSAQYLQQPTSEGAAIIKRENWRKWGVDTNADIAQNRSSCPGPQHAQAWAERTPPACDYIISSWDTAQKKTERADYSAMTNWGVFKAEDPKTGKVVNNLILLQAYKARMEFPELKAKVKQFYDEDQPDTLLIEDKGSGISLIQEFRAMGIPVENFSYGRGGGGLSNDKIARANLVSDIFASGYVYAPETRFADEVIEECAEFPAGSHDDYVDSTVQALLRFRAGGFIRTANDEDEEEIQRSFRRKRFY